MSMAFKPEQVRRRSRVFAAELPLFGIRVRRRYESRRARDPKPAGHLESIENPTRAIGKMQCQAF